jgi:hypothetical protein
MDRQAQFEQMSIRMGDKAVVLGQIGTNACIMAIVSADVAQATMFNLKKNSHSL